jgi:16S rRNA processing protein RimM
MARMKTILLGKITKINGFEGVVTVRTSRTFSGKIPEAESVFLEIDGRPVPFFVEYLEQNHDGSFRMKFEDYGSYEKMKEFAGCNVLVSSSDEEYEKEPDPEDLIGFKVFNEKEAYIGRINELIANPGQVIMCLTDHSGKEILLPLHEDLILRIDPETEQIQMTIPEGLTDLNG